MSHSMVTSTQRRNARFAPAPTRLSDQSMRTFIRMERRGQGPPTTIISSRRYHRIAAFDAWLLSRETDDSTVRAVHGRRGR
jgi:hypothetical protein